MKVTISLGILFILSGNVAIAMEPSPVPSSSLDNSLKGFPEGPAAEDVVRVASRASSFELSSPASRGPSPDPVPPQRLGSRLQRLPIAPELIAGAEVFFGRFPAGVSLEVFYHALDQLEQTNPNLHRYVTSEGMLPVLVPLYVRVSRLSSFLSRMAYQDTCIVRAFIIETYNDCSSEEYELLIKILTERGFLAVDGPIKTEVDNIRKFDEELSKRKRDRE